MSESTTLGAVFRTPLEMFYHWEQTRPNDAWLRQSLEGAWRDISWVEAGAQARRVGAALRALGLNHGDKIGIYAVNSPQWLIADVACMMAGMVTVPVYTTMPLDKVAYVAEHSDMAALFVDGSVDLDALRAALPAEISVIALPGGDTESTEANWDDILLSTEPLAGDPQRDGDDLWTIIYTSGTTGMPKGVMHSFSTLPHTGFCIPSFAGTNVDSRLFSYLPLAHAAERVLIELHSIYSGASIGFNDSRESFANDLREIRPTFFLAVPRIWINLKAGIIAQMGDEAWRQLTDQSEESNKEGRAALATMGLDAVSFAFSGAAPIAATDIRAWRALGMPLYEGFGQSEIMSGTVNRPGADCIGSVGKVIEGGEVSISDIGEILLRAPGGMLGYYNDPVKTAETVVDGWIRTGDKGRIDEDGFVHITGRVKEMFKTAKGKYVAPAPIENGFAACSLVDQLCLVGLGLPQTVMLVNLSPNRAGKDRDSIAETLEQQREQLNSTLEAHERISHVVVCAEPWSIDNGLLTHTLKILRDDVEKHHAAVVERCVELGSSETIVWE